MLGRLRDDEQTPRLEQPGSTFSRGAGRAEEPGDDDGVGATESRFVPCDLRSVGNDADPVPEAEPIDRAAQEGGPSTGTLDQ